MHNTLKYKNEIKMETLFYEENIIKYKVTLEH